MPKHKVTPRIWAADGWIKCKTPYDEARTPLFASKLKAAINWKLRQWSPSERVWLVDPSCLDTLKKLAKEYFPDVIMMNGTPDAAASGGMASDPVEASTYGMMANVLRAASSEALKKVYKTLAVDLHPDHGGDNDTMRRLNTAWDRIKVERGIR